MVGLPFGKSWIRPCKVAQLNIQIFQGSAATYLRQGSRFYYNFWQFLCECKSERIIRNDSHLQTCNKNKSGTFLWTTVYLLISWQNRTRLNYSTCECLNCHNGNSVIHFLTVCVSYLRWSTHAIRLHFLILPDWRHNAPALLSHQRSVRQSPLVYLTLHNPVTFSDCWFWSHALIAFHHAKSPHAYISITNLPAIIRIMPRTHTVRPRLHVK